MTESNWNFENRKVTHFSLVDVEHKIGNESDLLCKISGRCNNNVNVIN